MKFSMMSGVCDICGRARLLHVHDKCSKKRKAELKNRPTRNLGALGNSRTESLIRFLSKIN